MDPGDRDKLRHTILKKYYKFRNLEYDFIFPILKSTSRIGSFFCRSWTENLIPQNIFPLWGKVEVEKLSKIYPSRLQKYMRIFNWPNFHAGLTSTKNNKGD